MKYNKNIIPILIIIFCVSIIFYGCEKNKKDDEILSRTEFMMDTVVTIKLYGSEDEKILDEVFNRLKEIENRMSNVIKDSDISKINENAGKNPVEVHDDVYYVLTKAKYYAEISDGAYDPTIGPLVELWNIKGEEENKNPSIPVKENINEAIQKVDYTKLQLLDNNKVFLKDEGMKLDLGGIAKGYATDEVKKILKEKGISSAIIDLGGNIYAYGSKPTGEDWKIGIQNPFENTGSYVGIINVSDSSIVTSGNYERYFELNGIRYHHIIDCKTGYPSQNELSGVSVITKDSIDGDALSTALFILGTKKGTELINELDNIEGIFITKDREVYISPEIENNFNLKNSDFNIIINKY